MLSEAVLEIHKHLGGHSKQKFFTQLLNNVTQVEFVLRSCSSADGEMLNCALSYG